MNSKPQLINTPDGLVLKWQDLSLSGDFSPLKRRLKAPGKEMIVKAAGQPKEGECPVAVDATAGLGEDSFLLAAAGYRVLLFEKNPIIASLLADGIQKALNDPDLSRAASRMEIRQEDSLAALPGLSERPYLVYLDPMFPERSKSGLIKKKFQILKELELPCDDGEGLFNAALASLPDKIIVKRPLKAPLLSDKKPGYVIRGSVIRYDCYYCAASSL